GEVDVRGDVLQPGKEERVAVEAMPIMAAQRPRRALRMVVLALREAVVDEERDARLEELAHRAHQALRGEAEFGEVVVVAGREHRGGAAAQLALAEPLVLPGEARIGEDHAALEELALVTAHERERHHVEHLVRDDEAAKLHRERIEPGESPEVLRMALAEERVLALAQVRAHLEQEVVLRRRAEGLELLEEVGGEYAGSGSDLQDVAAHRLEHLARLQREAAREHGRDFGRGDEIAFRTELARPRGVIAEPGR